METDSLEKLLREADADAGSVPDVMPGLAERVRAADRRRRGFRAGGWSAAAAVLLAVSSYWWHLSGRETREPVVAKTESIVGRRPNAAELRRSIEMLDIQAEAVAAGARELLAQERAARLLADARNELRRPVPDAGVVARRAVEESAAVLVSRADRMCAEQGLCAAAAEAYESVIRLFPGSVGAADARRRLNELNTRQGASS